MTDEEYNTLTEKLANVLAKHIAPLVGRGATITLVVRTVEGPELLVSDDGDPKAVIEFLIDGYKRNYPGSRPYDTPPAKGTLQ